MQVTVEFITKAKLLLRSGFDRGMEMWNIFSLKQRTLIKYVLWIEC